MRALISAEAQRASARPKIVASRRPTANSNTVTPRLLYSRAQQFHQFPRDDGRCTDHIADEAGAAARKVFPNSKAVREDNRFVGRPSYWAARASPYITLPCIRATNIGKKNGAICGRSMTSGANLSEK